MRPVNLIPMEERRGERAPNRTGPLAYILIGGLCLVLGGLALLIQSGNKINESKADVARLKSDITVADASAAKLTPYTQFNALAAQRTQTITDLADSRFDWQRVIRELSLVIPANIQLDSLTGSVRPDVVVGEGEGVATRATVPGPALELIGCAPSQDGVADLVTQLHDIDGVTRVGVQSSAKSDVAAGGVAGSGGTCQINSDIAKFEIVLAFDAAPVPISSTAAPVAPVVTTPTETATATAETASTAASAGSDAAAPTDTGTGG